MTLRTTWILSVWLTTIRTRSTTQCIENTVYGLPLYITIQALGANKDMLEGRPAPTTASASRLQTPASPLPTFPTSWALWLASPMLSRRELKYAFTSDNMLNLLNAIEEMTKAGYMPNYAVEAGQRMVMCQQGKTMIFGKAMPLVREQHQQEQRRSEANDGTAVENSIP